jgi:calpain-7
LSSPTFLNNPQYKISIPGKAPVGLVIFLEAPRTFAINLRLIAGGLRAASPSSKDVLVHSGDYRHGFCYLEAKNIPRKVPKEAIRLVLLRLMKVLLAGDYTVVPSTFEPNQKSSFFLTVGSAVQVTIRRIPLEGEGMYKKIVHGQWISGVSSWGSPKLGDQYVRNPRYIMTVANPTDVM